MGFILTDLGEEYFIKNGVDSVSLTVGVYNDSTDSISDTNDIADITTEPGNTNYSRQSDTFAAADLSGDWGTDNNNQISFDFSDQTTSEVVDAYFVIANFQASDTGDGSATDHLIFTGALSQDRDIGSIDTLNLNAGGVGVKVT